MGYGRYRFRFLRDSRLRCAQAYTQSCCADVQGVDIMAFKRYWIKDRFERLEKMLQPKEGRYSHGDSITMADCVLVPQVRGRQHLALHLRVSHECAPDMYSRKRLIYHGDRMVHPFSKASSNAALSLYHAQQACSLGAVQVWNALNRYSIDMSAYPAIKEVYENCTQVDAVAAAMPQQQPGFTG